MKLYVPMTWSNRRELAPMRSILQKCPYNAHAPTIRHTVAVSAGSEAVW